MDYTEKEKSGIAKVDRMNRLFDKVIMPFIGIIVILLLISFIVGKAMEKFGRPDTPSTAVGDSVSDAKIFTLRSLLLQNYEQYAEGFAAYGYEPAEGYTQELALRKVVDEELTAYQFVDGSVGEFTILRYVPLEPEEKGYDYLALTVSSGHLVTATVKANDDSFTVNFTSTDFSSYAEADGGQYAGMMNLITKEELSAMYELFEADVRSLAKVCGAE